MSSFRDAFAAARARVGEDRVDLRVGALGRVVKQRQARRARFAADLDGVAGTRMSVVRDALVVLGREHRVVDDEVRSLAQPHDALAHLRQLSACPSRAARRPATAGAR